jgi:hypothetical protein
MIIETLKRFIASLLLHYILGWRMKGENKSFNLIQNGKHMIIYMNTHIIDKIICELFCMAYNIPAIATKIETMKDSPTIIETIVINKSENNVSSYIINELSNMKNYAYLPQIEEIMKDNDKDIINPLYFNIAQKAGTDLYMIRLDFSSNTIHVEELATDIYIQTNSHNTLKKLIHNKLKNEKPFNPNAFDINTINYLPRFMNYKKSFLLMLPPLYVAYVTMYAITYM